jgi:hypothetical protein
VVDANILRNDIRRACRTGQRTVLVTAANAGLIRLFCAQHVHDEVIEHSGEWTATGPVTRNDFLRAWLLEYLPLIRVVPIGDEHLAGLGPAELARVRYLAQPGQDPDDVSSAVLALLLGAFFLSGDGKPLRAVYGDADLSGHQACVDILKAGGDAGQLGKTLTLAANLTALAGQGMASGARRIAAATSPWVLLAAGLARPGGTGTAPPAPGSRSPPPPSTYSPARSARRSSTRKSRISSPAQHRRPRAGNPWLPTSTRTRHSGAPACTRWRAAPAATGPLPS